jgi:hypothetical protein
VIEWEIENQIMRGNAQTSQDVTFPALIRWNIRHFMLKIMPLSRYHLLLFLRRVRETKKFDCDASHVYVSLVSVSDGFEQSISSSSHKLKLTTESYLSGLPEN